MSAESRRSTGHRIRHTLGNIIYYSGLWSIPAAFFLLDRAFARRGARSQARELLRRFPTAPIRTALFPFGYYARLVRVGRTRRTVERMIATGSRTIRDEWPSSAGDYSITYRWRLGFFRTTDLIVVYDTDDRVVGMDERNLRFAIG